MSVTSEPGSVNMGAPHDVQSVSEAASWWPQAEHFIWMSVMSPKTYTAYGVRPMTSVTKSRRDRNVILDTSLAASCSSQDQEKQPYPDHHGYEQQHR